MPRDRTTTSCMLLVASLLVRSAMPQAAAPTCCSTMVAIARQARAAPQPAPQIFPSDPLWTVDISAKPVTSPAASVDRLFLALESGVSARRLSDGSEIWSAKVVASGPMAVAGDRLIVASKGEVRALDIATGATVWTQQVGDLTAPPVAHGDALLLATAKHFAAHRVADGSQTWARELGVVEQRAAVDGSRVYVPVSDGKLVVADLASGEAVWEVDVGIEPTEPLVYGDRVYFGSAAKKFCSLRKDSGAEVWCPAIGAVVIGAPVTDGTRVFLVALDNQLYALDRDNGSRRWKEDLKYRPSTGPTIVGRSISAPGRAPQLQAYDTVTKARGPVLTLPAPMVEAPVFIPSVDGAPVKVAALAGGLENVWKLTLAWPAPPQPPALAVTPVSELPGQVVPIGTPPAPRE